MKAEYNAETSCAKEVTCTISHVACLPLHAVVKSSRPVIFK